MFCKKCGKELSEQALVCLKCGTPTINYKGSEKKSSNNVTKEKAFNLYVLFKYITAITMCLSLLFLLWSICSPEYGVWEDLYLDANKLTSYYGKIMVYGDITIYWFPNYALSIVFLVLASLSFILSIVTFVKGFAKENKERRFATDMMFIVSCILLFISILNICG